MPRTPGSIETQFIGSSREIGVGGLARIIFPAANVAYLIRSALRNHFRIVACARPKGRGYLVRHWVWSIHVALCPVVSGC